MRLSKTHLFSAWGCALIKPGDVMAIRGSGLLSNLICDMTGPISHVGIVGAAPVPDPRRIEVIQALTKVEQVPLADSIANAHYAYILHALTLTDDQRAALVNWAQGKLGTAYDYADLLWQACDKIGRTDWFTQHWASRDKEICSELVAQDYSHIGFNFGVADRTATPVDIYDFALANGAKYQIIPLKGAP